MADTQEVRHRFPGGSGPAVVRETGHKIAIGLTGEPVATDRRSGAITHRKDHCLNSAHIGARTVRSR